MQAFECVVAAAALAASMQAGEPSPAPAAVPVREGFAVGLLATPALEGGGPWFMPAVRLSAPLGAKHGLDVGAGRIFGGSHKYAEIRRFYAGQFRFMRAPREHDPAVRYWLAGLTFINITKLDGTGGVRSKKPTAFLTAGHGWSQAFPNGSRVVAEIGFSGGDGFMVYTTVGVLWGPDR